MRIIVRLLCVLSLLAPCLAWADPTVIYLVRHGEKQATGKDPALTAQGQARAQNIATILQKAGIGHIFSSDFARTRQTAQPLAQRTGLVVQTYDAATPKVLAEKVKSLNGAVLVVGHSNTLPGLVRLFGGAPGADIADNEYDRMYQLLPAANGTVTTVLLTSLPAMSAAPE